MSENPNKIQILRVFETNSDVTGMVWLDCFLALRNEATVYAANFLAATVDLVGLARDIGVGASAVASIGRMEFERKEAAKAAVLRQKKEILAKKKNLTPAEREALEKLVADVLVSIDKRPEFKEETREALLRERIKITLMQDTMEAAKEVAFPAAQEAVAKLPPFFDYIEKLPELKVEKTNQAFKLWKSGLRGMIGACRSYIRWTETADIQFLNGILFPGPSVTAGINTYLRACGSRKTDLAGAGPGDKRQVENRPQNETLLEIIQQFCKEDILSEIPEVIKISYS